MVIIVRPLPELLICFGSGQQPRRHPLDISCDALVVRLAASARTKSERRRIHEVLAVRPSVRVVQRVAAHPCWRFGTRSRSGTLSLWRVVDMAPGAVRSVALPGPQSFRHHVFLPPTGIVSRSIGCITGSTRPVHTRRNRWPPSLAIRRLALP